MRIVKYETKLRINASVDELADADDEYCDRLEVFFEGKSIFKVGVPLDDLMRFVKQLVDLDSRFLYKTESGSWGKVLVLEVDRFCLFKEDDGSSSIIIQTFLEDEEKHYKKVEEVKAAIEERGFSVGSGKCQITTRREC